MSSLPLVLGQRHDCSYLPGREARSVFVDPFAPMTMDLYAALAALGFRRSGNLVYRPYCQACKACLPARVPVSDFTPNRAQDRTWRRNNDLTVLPKPAGFSEEHYRLFQRYLDQRHADGGMAGSTQEDYVAFLIADWADTEFVEFRLGEQLLAVAIVDVFPKGLSAVYTFFDPSQPRRSLGAYAVLWQIAEARRRKMEWVYLGYWIADCRKMAYKSQYQPLELFWQGHWQASEKIGKDAG